MHLTTAVTFLSFILCCQPLSLFAADSSTIPESKTAEPVNKLQRIPWIKPTIPLNTTLKSSMPAQPAKPLLTTAEVETLKHNQAFAALKNAQFDKAISLFRDHISTYPKSKYTAGNHFWIAEACFLSKNYSGALEEYSHLMIYYPNSREAEEAALKSGLTFYEMNNWHRAQKSLNHAASAYPHSITAKKAQAHLKLMKRKGLLDKAES